MWQKLGHTKILRWSSQGQGFLYIMHITHSGTKVQIFDLQDVQCAIWLWTWDRFFSDQAFPFYKQKYIQLTAHCFYGERGIKCFWSYCHWQYLTFKMCNVHLNLNLRQIFLYGQARVKHSFFLYIMHKNTYMYKNSCKYGYQKSKLRPLK